MTQTPSLPPISKIGTRDRFAGHQNHLTEAQEKAFVAFKEQLEAGGYYTPALGDADASHDETTLLRFLRARKFDPHGAYAQFTSSEDWRRSLRVPELYDQFSVEEFTSSEMVYPQWTGRRDKLGLPLYLFRVGYLTKEVVANYNKAGDRLDARMIALYEHMVQFALPFCSDVPHANQEIPVSATTTIVDISHVSLSRFWHLRSHMQRASTLATANYAETLGAIYIVGAPNFFSVVWGWIGKWFDPGTVEKIFILSHHEVFTVLSRFIDPADIPKQYGGQLEFEFSAGTGPNLDQAAKETLGLDKLPRGSVRWIKGELMLAGTGRSKEEVEEVSATRKVKVAPVVAATVEPKTEVRTSSADPQGVSKEPHDIKVAAREHPSAPVKELAAALEGTTL